MSTTPRDRALRTAFRAALSLPAAARRALVGATRRNQRGDALAADIQLLVVAADWVRPRAKDPTVEEARRELLGSVRLVEGAPRRVAWTEDRTADGVRVRIYGPDGPGPHPVLVYAHGGGWCVGDLASHDTWCRRLCADGRQIVVAVDYRLAPEHPYPAGLEDVLRVWRWARDRYGEAAIGGDSAGGNLAAAACLRLRDAGEPQPRYQLLVYPAGDLRCLSESYRELGQGYLLTADAIQWYLRRYACDPQDPRGSVLLEPDLRGLAPAIVVTAGFDPLRDDGEQYAARLREAGIVVEEHRFSGLVHGFLAMDGAAPSADRACAQVVDATRRRWR